MCSGVGAPGCSTSTQGPSTVTTCYCLEDNCNAASTITPVKTILPISISFIVWHMLDMSGEFSGIFYNRNICAAWLSESFPFFIAAASCEIISRKNLIKQVATWLILFSVSLAMVLTNSRNAVVALVLGSLGMVSGVIFKKFNILKHNLFIVGAACSAFLLAFYIIYPIAPLSSFLDTLIQFASDDDRLRTV